ncbi:hypothetical protein CR513_28134, partial [Mucuna pruriens]
MFMDDPRKPHLAVAKGIIRYLQGTLEYGVLFLNKMKQGVNIFYVHQFIDAQRNNMLLLYHPAKLSMLQDLMPHVQLFGYRHYWRQW